MDNIRLESMLAARARLELFRYLHRKLRLGLHDIFLTGFVLPRSGATQCGSDIYIQQMSFDDFREALSANTFRKEAIALPTHNVVLTDHQDSLVDRLVKSGRYQSASEVLREGLRLIEREHAENRARDRSAA